MWGILRPSMRSLGYVQFWSGSLQALGIWLLHGWLTNLISITRRCRLASCCLWLDLPSCGAAIIALTWTGILRIGEVLGGIGYILLQVPEPKTRGRGARHQSARIDPIDIVLLISTVFAGNSADQKLWPYSAATLRRRFGQLLSALRLQSKVVNGIRPWRSHIPFE